MTHSNKRKPGRGNGIRLATVTMEAVAGLTPMVHELMERLPIPKPGENSRKELVNIPPLYSKDSSIELNRAVELLAAFGLKAEPVELYIPDARIDYRDCFNFQVVDSNFMRQQKVVVGSPIIIRYITQEVIDESRRLFYEEERRKENLRHRNKRYKRNNHDG